MREFIEKLICRLEEKKGKYFDGLVCEGTMIKINDVISIVNQLAEEYNNDWISCSERLPEKEIDVLVCFSNDMDCVIAYRTKMMNTNLEDVWVNSSTAHIISSNIIAWQPIPEPYHETKK